MKSDNGSWLLILIVIALAATAGGVAGVEIMSIGKLDASQILTYAANAGFVGQDLITAIAIALAESSGNPDAHGDTTIGSGTGSFGLWQINADAHPEYGPDFTALYDPQTNADAAYAIYQAAGNRFTPWSTFKNGMYLANMPAAQTAVANG
jgi:Lysozyme like domain